MKDDEGRRKKDLWKILTPGRKGDTGTFEKGIKKENFYH